MQTERQGKRRRSFIKGLVAGSAVLAGLFPRKDRAVAEQGQEGATVSQEVLYRETREFRKYYETLRS